MGVLVGIGALREVLVVFAVALLGLALAALVAFTPWYPPAAPDRPVVVELRAPPDAPPTRTPAAAVPW